MSLLEVLQLIGYSTGAWLHLWIGTLLVRGRLITSRMERVLLMLIVNIGLWHACNLTVLLPKLLGLDLRRATTMLRLADTVAVISITFSYSFLLHAHLYLWASARGRGFTWTEHARVYLSYIPVLFLVIAVPPLWAGDYAPLYDKLPHLVVPFALWAAYAMGVAAVTDLLIARRAGSEIEKRFLQLVAASFVVIGSLLLAAYPLGVGRGTDFNLLLQALANLGSLLPMALLVIHIYRHRYLELVIKDSLVVACFAVVILIVYLYGVRFIGAWLTTRYDLRAGAVESLLILALALLAAPTKRWLEKRLRNLFQRETTLYRDVVSSISRQAPQYHQLPELLRFIEERTQVALNLARVRLIAQPRRAAQSNDEAEAEAILQGSRDEDTALWIKPLLEAANDSSAAVIESNSALREHGFAVAYVLRREERLVGIMLVDAPIERLTIDVRQVLEVLAGQVAVAIEDCLLIEENVQLERRLAQGERLAALGQMAATVAHEVKNPLSAIKSIAQVMREDDKLAAEYGRDLDLIVSETNRLSQSVTQLLSFARHAPPVDGPIKAKELMRTVVELFRVEAKRHCVTIECDIHEADVNLHGAAATALRDCLSNLLLNALQASPRGARIVVEAHLENNHLLVAVTDSGAGIAPELRERIWEPFFTTKQRGTGLGLAIVRKRIQEAGGTVRLAATENGSGARFELRLPIHQFLTD